MNRREFLTRGGRGITSILIAGYAPSLLRGADSTNVTRYEPRPNGQDKRYVGQGDYVFEWVDRPMQPPAGVTWHQGHGGFAQFNNEIYFAQSGNKDGRASDNIWVFDGRFNFVRSFGRFFDAAPHGVAIRTEVNTTTQQEQPYIYLAYDSTKTVVKSDLQGNEVWRRTAPVDFEVNGKRPYTAPEHFAPTNVTFTNANTVLVADGYGKGYVHEYDSNGRWLRAFGGAGVLPGQFNTPHGIATTVMRGILEVGERVIVADRGNSRLQQFTRNDKGDFVVERVYDGNSGKIKYDDRNHDDWNLVRRINGGRRGDELRLPCNIRFGKSMTGEKIAVVPELDHRVSLYQFNAELQWWNVLAHLGDGNMGRTIKGHPYRADPVDVWNRIFAGPHFADFVNGDDILVTQWVVNGSGNVLLKRI